MIDQCDLVEGNDVYFLLYCIIFCRGFKFVCINVNSLCKYIDEICYILINFFLEVLVINEFKFDGIIFDIEVYIFGYIIICKDCSWLGGGVVFYIRENLLYINRIDFVFDILEIICVEINFFYSRLFLVSIWYRLLSVEMQVFDEYEKFVQCCDIEYK